MVESLVEKRLVVDAILMELQASGDANTQGKREAVARDM